MQSKVDRSMGTPFVLPLNYYYCRLCLRISPRDSECGSNGWSCIEPQLFGNTSKLFAEITHCQPTENISHVQGLVASERARRTLIYSELTVRVQTQLKPRGTMYIFLGPRTKYYHRFRQFGDPSRRERDIQSIRRVRPKKPRGKCRGIKSCIITGCDCPFIYDIFYTLLGMQRRIAPLDAEIYMCERGHVFGQIIYYMTSSSSSSSSESSIAITSSSRVSPSPSLSGSGSSTSSARTSSASCTPGNSS